MNIIPHNVNYGEFFYNIAMHDSHLQNSPTKTRHDLQWGRRFFHAGAGTLVGSAYALLFSRTQVISILGTIACILYLLEQIRISYPEIGQKLKWINEFFLRAEEQVKESAAVPYALAVLLTIITFPKEVALIAIFTLALGDPLSAITGITFGKHKIISGKSLEGSLAFFSVAFLVVFLVLSISTGYGSTRILGVSLMIGLLGSLVEMIPSRLDDNLTIPLFMSFIAWICLYLFEVAV